MLNIVYNNYLLYSIYILINLINKILKYKKIICVTENINYRNVDQIKRFFYAS